MTTQPGSDPMRLLANLQRVEPPRGRDEAIRARCHVLVSTARYRAVTSRSPLEAIVDAALAVAVVLYGAVAVAEALRLTLR